MTWGRDNKHVYCRVSLQCLLVRMEANTEETCSSALRKQITVFCFILLRATQQMTRCKLTCMWSLEWGGRNDYNVIDRGWKVNLYYDRLLALWDTLNVHQAPVFIQKVIIIKCQNQNVDIHDIYLYLCMVLLHLGIMYML